MRRRGKHRRAWPLSGRSLAAAAAVPLVLGVAWVEPAFAAKRFASPTGGEVEPCAEINPCSLRKAIEGAHEGDEVEVLVGASPYAVTAPIATALDLSVHGPPSGALPEIDDNEASASLLLFNGTDMVSRLRLVGTKQQQVLIAAANKGVLDDLIVEARGEQAGLVRLVTGAVLRDSVLFSGASVKSAVGLETTFPQTSFARNDTISLPGTGSIGVASEGFCVPDSEHPGKCLVSSTGSIDIANSIVRGGGADLETTSQGGFAGTLTVSHSNYRAANTKEASGGPIVDGGGNQVAAEPALTSDFHELAGSVTIDAGALVSELGSVDLDGTARLQGPNPDIGAYELPVPLPPKPPAPAPSPPSPPLTPVGTASAAGAAAHGLAVTVPLGCSGAAGLTCTLTITLTTTEHLAGKRLTGVSSAAGKRHTREVTVGLVHLTLKAGQLRTPKVALNATGRKLAARFHRLPVTVTTTSLSSAGKTVTIASRRLTLKPPRRRTHH